MSAICTQPAPADSGTALLETLRVLVVDDHVDIREPLAQYLGQRGLAVSSAADAEQARHLLRYLPFDIVVLDIMLPDEDGLSLCRHVMQTLDTPVILLTAMAAPPDRVAGLETGADDYVVKPFDPGELVARIRTVLRRHRRHTPSARGISTRFAFNGWVFDMTRRELTDATGRLVALSEAEHQLLCVLVTQPKVVLSRDRLLELTERNGSQVFDRSVDTQISRLRRKLETDPRSPELIKTAWGTGYLFTADVKSLAA
jgi:two-component system OmpR family response regulator